MGVGCQGMELLPGNKKGDPVGRLFAGW